MASRYRSALLSASLLCVNAAFLAARPERPEATAKSLYATAANKVVTILVFDRANQQIATGSGVIVSSDGKIITNYHVVSGGTFFDVRLPSQTERAKAFHARPVACSEASDLALLAITPDHPLPFARLAKTRPAVGDRVFAIGSPYELEGSLSEGVVSQLRELRGTPLIQTTAQISAGSSGGGLFLKTGELVGITEMTLEGGQGLNFAVLATEITNLAPCSDFGEPSSRAPRSQPTAVPVSADCKPNLHIESAKESWVPFTSFMRANGVIKNKGCGSSEGVRIRIEVFEAASNQYIISQNFTISAFSLGAGQLVDFDVELEMPNGTAGKTLTINYTVRDMSTPF